MIETQGQLNRILTLDGWRGIAILLVIVDHLQAQWCKRYLPFLHTGQHGVTLFFVLSGFLITNGLLQNGNLKTFYIRRVFRLMPVAWSYLGFLWVMGILFPASAPPVSEQLSSLFFFRNYIAHQSTFLSSGHFWSLSMEEQFYLVWPPLLLLLGRRKSACLAAMAAVGCAAFRFTHWHAYNQIWMSFHTEVRADAICIGCLLAIALRNQRFREIAIRAVPYIQYPALFVFVLLTALTAWLPLGIECLAIAVLIAKSILTPDCMFSKILCFHPLRALGLVSYSIYVWQQFFLMPYGPAANALLDVLALVCGLSVYFLIEKPLTRLGRSIAAPFATVT